MKVWTHFLKVQFSHTLLGDRKASPASPFVRKLNSSFNRWVVNIPEIKTLKPQRTSKEAPSWPQAWTKSQIHLRKPVADLILTNAAPLVPTCLRNFPVPKGAGLAKQLPKASASHLNPNATRALRFWSGTPTLTRASQENRSSHQLASEGQVQLLYC